MVEVTGADDGITATSGPPSVEELVKHVHEAG